MHLKTPRYFVKLSVYVDFPEAQRSFGRKQFDILMLRLSNIAMMECQKQCSLPSD